MEDSSRVALNDFGRLCSHLFLRAALLHLKNRRFTSRNRARLLSIANVTISLVCDALHKALRRVELSEAKAVQHVKDIEHRDQALRDAQQQLHLITDSMSALVTRCTSDLKYAWLSKPYADWLQTSRSEIVGASIEDVLGKTAFDVLRPYFQKTLTGETVRLEHEIEFRTIGRRWVNAVYIPKIFDMFTQADNTSERQHGDSESD